MKPIIIDNLEDLALAIKLSNAQKVRARNAEPPEYRHFTNAEGDLISKLPADQQSELKRLKTAPARKGYVMPNRKPAAVFTTNAVVQAQNVPNHWIDEITEVTPEQMAELKKSMSDPERQRLYYGAVGRPNTAGDGKTER